MSGDSGTHGAAGGAGAAGSGGAARAAGGGIYSAALMDHNAHPDYKYELEGATHVHDGINASCGDEMTLFLKIDEETNTILEVSFTGHGCAISQASADMMAGLIEGESVEEAKRLSGLFIQMIQGRALTDEEREDLDEAAELASISRMPARVKCAELAWRTLGGILAERERGL